MEMLNSMLISAINDYGPIRIVQSVLVILMAVLAVAIIVIVLMQKGTSDNIGAIGGGETDSYMGKNKGQNKERALKIATAVIGGVMVVVAIVYFVLMVL